jgi:hypothetical protein
MKKKIKKHGYDIVLLIILYFVCGLIVGFENQNVYWANKYSQQSETFKRTVVAYKQTRDVDMDSIKFEVQCHMDALWKYAEMKDYAHKLEKKLEKYRHGTH